MRSLEFCCISCSTSSSRGRERGRLVDGLSSLEAERILARTDDFSYLPHDGVNSIELTMK
jgi:hypothetical protein